MIIWALSDLHLSFGCPEKSMDVFGKTWQKHSEKIAHNWLDCVKEEDLVLIAGDISWAMKADDALKDLEWISQLPGYKLLLKGNHDYWWSSKKKMQTLLPVSVSCLSNNAFDFADVSIAGSRLWDSTEYSFDDYILWDGKETTEESRKTYSEEDAKIFERELHRLELSLQALNEESHFRIAMTHYPPISASLEDSKTSKLLEKYKVDLCVFGHLHNVKKDSLNFGKKNGVHYVLSSCDYIDFKPIKLYEF